jgi:hypothetical protein
MVYIENYYSDQQIKTFLMILESIVRSQDEGPFILGDYQATLKITECERIKRA